MVHLLHGHSLDEQPHHALPLAIRRPRVAPEAGKISREIHHRLPLRRTKVGLILLMLLLGGFTHFRPGAQFGIPLRLQHIGHQPVLWGDAEIAPLRQRCFILGALHLELPQPCGCGGPSDELILHGEGQRDRLGRHHLHEDVGDGPIEIAPGHALTGWFSAGNARTLTELIRHNPPPPALLIAHGHPLPAAATQHQPL